MTDLHQVIILLKAGQVYEEIPIKDYCAKIFPGQIIQIIKTLITPVNWRHFLEYLEGESNAMKISKIKKEHPMAENKGSKGIGVRYKCLTYMNERHIRKNKMAENNDKLWS